MTFYMAVMQQIFMQWLNALSDAPAFDRTREKNPLKWGTNLKLILLGKSN